MTEAAWNSGTAWLSEKSEPSSILPNRPSCLWLDRRAEERPNLSNSLFRMALHDQADQARSPAAAAASLISPAATASSSSTTGEDAEQQHRLHKRRLVLLLNKLTPTNFELHVSQYLTFVHEHGSGHRATSFSTNYAREHDRFLRDAVRAIVDRAGEDGTRYSSMYAKLCHRLSSDWWTTPSCVGSFPSFHEVLMEECQERLVGGIVGSGAGVGGSTEGTGEDQQHPILSVLMRGIGRHSGSVPGNHSVEVRVHRNDEIDDDDGDDDDDWRALLAKKLYVNHVLFVAELFKCGLVNVQTITDVVHILCRLAGLDISTDRYRASTLLSISGQFSMPSLSSPSAEEREVRLEALLLVLDRMGFKLEIPPLSTALEEIGCWEALQDLTDMAGNAQDDQDVMNRRLTNRLRFMIMDLVELRSSGWRRSGPLQHRKMIMAESLDAFRSTEGADKDGTDSMRGKKKRKKKDLKKIVSFGASSGH